MRLWEDYSCVGRILFCSRIGIWPEIDSLPLHLKKIIQSDQPLWIEIIQENEDLPDLVFGFIMINYL